MEVLAEQYIEAGKIGPLQDGGPLYDLDQSVPREYQILLCNRSQEEIDVMPESVETPQGRCHKSYILFVEACVAYGLTAAGTQRKVKDLVYYETFLPEQTSPTLYGVFVFDGTVFFAAEDLRINKN